MKKEDYSQLTIEELTKKEKTAKTATVMLAVVIVLQFLVGLFLTFKQGFNVFTILPVTFLPILIVNYSIIKKIREEINSRDKN
ncbi:redox-active disulfide protein 2 [Flavobacterium sp.]|uniref:redox-active disulfide protein 2 n=1 Tax=Flavobacterium sp. TaxID=239 RepID=UPI002B4B1381|nr:redox-active disulfide protein 2 [Flavobacterium sp.]HLP64886.1 hypothetical protein [Flavobacterium sp.]